MRPLTVKKGFSFIELMVGIALFVIVGLVFWSLLKTGIWASDRGKTSAQGRENARIAVDRIQAELRQATPVPVEGAGVLPAVIYPAIGGSLLNGADAAESAAVGCSLAPGACITAQNTSPLNASVAVAGPQGVQQQAAGPSGFLIFSELQSTNNNLTADPAYAFAPQNYVWVMYQIIPGTLTVPAQLVRYTFNVGNGSAPNGIKSTLTGWSRIDNYFIPGNSIEGAGNGVPIVTLSRPGDGFWIMVSHGNASQSVSISFGNAVYDPQLFNVTAVVNQFSTFAGFGTSVTPLSSILSSQIKVEGGSLF